MAKEEQELENQRKNSTIRFIEKQLLAFGTFLNKKIERKFL